MRRIGRGIHGFRSTLAIKGLDSVTFSVASGVFQPFASLIVRDFGFTRRFFGVMDFFVESLAHLLHQAFGAIQFQPKPVIESNSEHNFR